MSSPQNKTTQSAQTPESTAVLLQAARDGDPLAWEELIRRYSRFVRAVVASFRLQTADAEDAVQTTWLRVVERTVTIKDPQCLGSWLETTARRECLALIRRLRREAPGEAVEHLVAVEAGPERAVVDGEVHRAVDTAVGELTGRRRLMIDLLFREPHCSYAEVSRVTGMPQGSIGPTRARVLQELRCAMERAGFGPYAGAA
jgi:RNA polymerase sigma factor (sigma-70 family)